MIIDGMGLDGTGWISGGGPRLCKIIVIRGMSE